MGQDSRKRLAEYSAVGFLMTPQSRAGVLPADHLQKDLLPSSLNWLLGRFNYLQTVGLRASVHCWLLASSCRQFLPMWASAAWQLILLKPTREPSTSKMGITVLYNWITEETSHHFYYSLVIRSKSPCLAHTQELLRTWVRDHLKPCQKLLATNFTMI